MNILTELRNDIEGAKLLKDWLGDGGQPVPSLRAESRAEACVHGNNGKACPMNTAPNWWDRFKNAIALTIRAELELKNHLNLRVEPEDDLHMCGVCGCCLKLKVWTPIEHVKTHTSLNKISKAPGFCWMRREIEQ